jgi:hypothetical protein
MVLQEAADGAGFLFVIMKTKRLSICSFGGFGQLDGLRQATELLLVVLD